MTPEKRIQSAVEIASRFAQIDGGHHRLWVIDQMMQRLLGKKQYKEFVKEYEEVDEDGEVMYEWDTGIAP